MRRIPLRSFVLLVTAGASASSLAHADDAQSLVAQSLFEEGRTLMEAGRVSEACAKLARSQMLDPSGGTSLNLAVCREREGRVATAHAEFERALAQATRDNRPDRAELAREHLDALRGRLPRLVVDVTSEPAASVEIDGVTVPSEAWGTPIAVDPGEHVVRARAPGKAPAAVRVIVREGETQHATIPALAAGPAEPPPRGRGDRQRTVGLVLGGSGLVLLAASIPVLVWTMGRVEELEACKPRCSDSEVDAAWDASTGRFWATTGTFLGGGLLLAGGIVFFTAPRAKAPAVQVAATGPGSMGVRVSF